MELNASKMISVSDRILLRACDNPNLLLPAAKYRSNRRRAMRAVIIMYMLHNILTMLALVY